MKHSKFAEGIEHSYVHNAKLLPPQVDPDSVRDHMLYLYTSSYLCFFSTKLSAIYSVFALFSRLNYAMIQSFKVVKIIS